MRLFYGMGYKGTIAAACGTKRDRQIQTDATLWRFLQKRLLYDRRIVDQRQLFRGNPELLMEFLTDLCLGIPFAQIRLHLFYRTNPRQQAPRRMQICDLFQQPEQHGTEPVFAQLLVCFRRTGREKLLLLQRLSQVLHPDKKAALTALLFQRENSTLFCILRQLRRIIEKRKLSNRQENLANTFDFIFQRVSRKGNGKRLCQIGFNIWHEL